MPCSNLLNAMIVSKAVALSDRKLELRQDYHGTRTGRNRLKEVALPTFPPQLTHRPNLHRFPPYVPQTRMGVDQDGPTLLTACDNL